MSFTDGHGVEVRVGGHAFICVLYHMQTCEHAGWPALDEQVGGTHTWLAGP